MKNCITILLTILILSPLTYSQVSIGGKPVSFSKPSKATVPTVKTPPINRAKMLNEDIEEGKLGMPYRFGTPFDVNYTLENSGVWETSADGSRMWQLRIETSNAYAINLIYDHFEIPEGARFYIYNEDKSMVIGAFTSENNKEYKKFSTAPVQGPVSILEYFEPADAAFRGIISIERIVHAYRDIFSWDVAKAVAGFGSSGSCNNNVNCPEGDPWQDEKRAVVMLLTGGGFRFCSGAMINNVREDLTPYLLTAEHCLGGESTWLIMYNYESPTCDNINGPTYMTVSGTTLLANNGYSDFALLRLSENPPDSYDVYYAGWSAIDSPAPRTVGIHHPSGDIKKISFDSDPVIETSYLGSSGDSHWRVVKWDDGTTEGGSSGSPLFDDNHRIIGQLHGGFASCSSPTSDWYGQFSESWDHGSNMLISLKEWLDPDNTGTMVLDGIDAAGLTFTADTTIGWVPLLVNFNATSKVTPVSWTWDFGDGDSAFVEDPTHLYDTPGLFDVKLEIDTSGVEDPFRLRSNYIAVLADTIIGEEVEYVSGSTVEVVISARNNVPVGMFKIPIEYGGDIDLNLQSYTTSGYRTEYFEDLAYSHDDPNNNRKTIRLRASTNGSQPELPPGDGPILKLTFTFGSNPNPDQITTIQVDGYIAGTFEFLPQFTSSVITFNPASDNGSVFYPACCFMRGDVDHSGELGISDVTFFVTYFFAFGDEPPCDEEANVDAIGILNIADLTYLVDYIFNAGPIPPDCL